ncbi:MAG: hypothetical protein DMG02_16740 [Acidobacteria bacterium]|nr:MAG: hypothetical protein DMG02_16740 [Acidobacteriota bacterium]
MASWLVIAPFLLFGSALAPLHVHEPGAGHSHALVHSHFALHHFESQQPEGAEFEQGPERVIWLESAILHQTAYHADSGPPPIAASFDTIPAVPSWSSTPFDDVAPAHGPPRRHLSFRGPPLFLA